jgi:hypothetical protein
MAAYGPDDLTPGVNSTLIKCDTYGGHFDCRYTTNDRLNFGTCTYEDANHVNAYMFAAVGFTFSGGIANFLASIFIPLYFWNKPPTFIISTNEWADFLHTLQNHIIGKLEALIDADQPTEWRQVKKLVDETSSLHEDKTKDETITVFTRILAIIKQLRTDLNLSKKPFSISLFANKTRELREIVIEDSVSERGTDYSSEDEVRPLLRVGPG